MKAHSTSVFGSACLHRLKSGFLSIASLLLLTSCAGPSLEPVTGEEHGDPQLLREVDGRVRTLMRKNHIPGLSIGIVHEGKTLVLRGYGAADRESEVPVTPDTIFRAYSIAKLFAGLAVVYGDGALHMSGVGYLREREPGFFEVVGGVYDGETVTRDPATGALTHQGILYERK